MDKQSPDLRHSADRDSHFLAAPHVPLLEEHVGYQMAARFHDQPLDLPYLTVGRTHGDAAVYAYRAGWNGVDGDLLRGFRCARAAGSVHPNEPVDPFRGIVVPGRVEAPHGLGLLGGPERLELGQAAAKPELARRSVYKVSGNKPPRARPALGVDREMRDLPGDRVDDDAAHLTAGSIGAPGAGADPDRHHLRHPLVFLWTLASPASSSTSELPDRGQPHPGRAFARPMVSRADGHAA